MPNNDKSYAHSLNDNNEPHYLDDHLQTVAKLAKELMPDELYKEVAFYTGLWHDLGKYNPQWQARLKAIAPNSNERIGIRHAWHGAVWANDYSLPAAFCIAGHHAGLPNRTDLRSFLADATIKPELIKEYQEAIAYSATDFPDELQPSYKLPAPDLNKDWERWDLMTRFLFSALVDADYTDTAQHFDPSLPSKRSHPTISQLLIQFEDAREKLIANSKSNPETNQVRCEIYDYCTQGGKLPKGLFKLAAPTGGGKTLSLMGFGLHHAVTHGMRRIIYAAPFTSIIDQTADIYRQLLGKDVVLEHHSAVREENLPDDHMGKVRLAAQNWDFPIIVTTTVQLLESLFSDRPSQCRKLHNIANSVIVLDEVQALPIKYLTPILSILQALSDWYSCSIVFCTATQPAYKHLKVLKRQLTPIIPDPALTSHFSQLKRVDYLNQTAQSWTWADVAADILSRDLQQVLIVCNSVADAQAGFKEMESMFTPETCFHLSTRMYGDHRRRVLKQIQKQLKTKSRICLVSTQLIEAGVDLDFADGYRTIAPLDSIVQTAGRINRNGLLSRQGTLTVLKLKGGKFPGIDYELAARDSEKLLERGCNLNTPQVFDDYFKKRFRNQDTDAKRIQDYRQEQQFQEVSKKFQLIDNNEYTTPVFVADTPESKAILQEFESKSFLSAGDYRRIQPYLVNLPETFLKQRPSDIKETQYKLLVWQGDYDPKCGIL